jgi:hypothetical protein
MNNLLELSQSVILLVFKRLFQDWEWQSDGVNLEHSPVSNQLTLSVEMIGEHL